MKWKKKATPVVRSAVIPSDGRNHTAGIECQGASRFGRMFEMLVGGGQVEGDDVAALAAVQQLHDKTDATFEALVLPGPVDGGGKTPVSASSFVFRGPNFQIGLQDGRLLLSQNSGISWTGNTQLPQKAFHLVVIRKADAFEAWVEGSRMELKRQDTAPNPASLDSLVFGGGWNRGLLNIALYGRTIDAAEVVKNSASMLREVTTFPSAAPQAKLRAKLVESSVPPSLEDIKPYTGSLVTFAYEVEQVLAGDFKDKRILVKHWGLLNNQLTAGLPREVGKSYELLVEKEQFHPELKGERVEHDTTVLDLEPWFDVTQPSVIPQP